MSEASRLRKRQAEGSKNDIVFVFQVEALTPETKNTLEDRRQDMLTQAKKCFNEALHKPDNDEPWLQRYMLGKIAEKMCRPPEEYLESYLKVYCT